MMRRDISKESIRNPMGELLAPTEYEEDVHAFSRKNRELLQKGEEYLETSGMQYDEAKHGSMDKYVTNELIPVLTDLQKRIKADQWAVDNNKKKIVFDFLTELKRSYENNPEQAAAKEFVMFHHILKEEEDNGVDSPFVILFANILECYDAYEGDATSCKPGIMERIRRDAGVKVITQDYKTEEIIVTGFEAMQNYHLEYLNRFCMSNGDPSSLLCAIVTDHIATRIKAQQNPEEVIIKKIYKDTEYDVKRSLAAYTKAMGMPEASSWFNYATSRRLDREISDRIFGVGGFFEDRDEDIESGDYSASWDASMARADVIDKLKAECVRYCLQNDLPINNSSWYEILRSVELKKQVVSNEEYIERIIGNANTRFHIALNSLGLEAKDITPKEVMFNINQDYDAQETGFSQVGLQEIDHDMCRRHLEDAIKKWDAEPFILTCYDSQDISDKAYQDLQRIVSEHDDMENSAFLSNEILRSIIAISLSKEDGKVDTFAERLDMPTSHFIFRYAQKDNVINWLNSNPLDTKMFSSKDSDDRSILMVAADSGNLDILKILLEHESCTAESLLEQDIDGHTAISLAEQAGSDVVKEIINSPKCTVDMLFEQDQDGKTVISSDAPIMFEYAKKDTIINWLNSDSLNPEMLSKKDLKLQSILKVAANSGNMHAINAVKEIIYSPQCTVDMLFEQDQDGKTVISSFAPIMFKYAQKDTIVNWLKSDSLNPEMLSKKDLKLQSILTAAANSGNMDAIDAVKEIINSPKCTVDMLFEQDQDGKTVISSFAPIMFEYAKKDTIINWLNSDSLNSEIFLSKDSDDRSILMVAANSENIDAIEVLLENDYCTAELLSAKDYAGQTILMTGNLAVVNEILNSTKCTPELLLAKNNRGRTALMTENLAVVKEILNSTKCTPELLSAKDNLGQTALNSAVENGLATVVAAILESDHSTPESIFDEDEEGQSVLWHAIYSQKETCRTDTLKAIIDSQQFTSKHFDSNGLPLLCEAMLAYECSELDEDSALKFVELILNSPKFTPDQFGLKTLNGIDGLMYAAKNNFVNIVQAILNSPKCPPELLSAQDKYGQTALKLAEDKGYHEVVDIINQAILQKSNQNEGPKPVSSADIMPAANLRDMTVAPRTNEETGIDPSHDQGPNNV